MSVTLIAAMLISGACLADPQRTQSIELLDRLSAARGLFAQQPPHVDDGCTVVGDVQTRLYGEPGLVDVQPAWSQLRQVADALQAICGEDTLLLEPAPDTAPVQAAHQRWQDGIQREMGVACDHLRAAATALGRAAAC